MKLKLNRARVAPTNLLLRIFIQTGNKRPRKASENKVATLCASLSQNLPTVIGTQPQAILAGLFGSRKWQAAGSGGRSTASPSELERAAAALPAGAPSSARPEEKILPDQHLLMSHVPTCLPLLPLGWQSLLARSTATTGQRAQRAPANDGSGLLYLARAKVVRLRPTSSTSPSSSKPASSGAYLTFQLLFYPRAPSFIGVLAKFIRPHELGWRH